MTSKDFISGLLLGAGIGLAVGIATAPGKGNETLKKLTDSLKDTFNKYKGEAENALHNAKSKGESLLNEGNDVAQEYMEDGEQKIHELKNKFNNAANV